MKTLFKANKLIKRYKNRTVVNGIDLVVYEDEILAIIGPNGAGKTTTIEMILGIREPDSGKISFWCKEYKKFIGAQLQAAPFFPGITVKDNIYLFSCLYGLKLSKNKVKDVLEKFSLVDVEKTNASKISVGQQKRLAIAITTLHKPKLIILDEPTASLDPRGRHEIRQLITNLNQSNTAIMFTSHEMEEVYKIAHRVVMISNGKVLADGTPYQLCKDFKVQNLDDLYFKLTIKEGL